MGLFDKMFGGRQETAPAVETEKNMIYAPLPGTAISLEEIGDGVFSEGILGKGCGIKPDAETVLAPVNGKVIQVADTRHAVCILGDDGMELLIHVGLDTVSMNGKGFEPLVKEGDQVKCGQKLLNFNKKSISEAGFSDTVIIVVTNTDEYKEITLEKSGSVAASEKLLHVV